MTPEELKRLAGQLRDLSQIIAAEIPDSISPNFASQIRKTLEDAFERLREATKNLDPIKQPGYVFDPSNPSLVGRFVGIALIAQPRTPMVNIGKFYGSGVYALYYRGKFPAYRRVSGREHPIYVGKADPADPTSKTATDQGDRLSKRLDEHRRNIERAQGSLRIEDFEYRALVVQSGWQVSAEDYLIHLFKPIWNNEIGICYGFGKHGDSADTRANKRSPWDVLHPGRKWAGAMKLDDAKSEKQILEEINKHLLQNPPLGSVDEILKRFLEEMSTVSN